VPDFWQKYLSPAVEFVRTDAQGLIAIAKAPGQRVHPNAPEEISSKNIAPYAYDFEKERYLLPDGQFLYVLHRLDAPTSGILLLTLEEQVAEAVRRAFRERRCQKTYQAWVKGRTTLPASGLWRDRLLELQTPVGLRVRVNPRGLPAETRYEVMAAARVGNHSLLRLHLYPSTGRTHQLRVQCAHRGCPVLGDRTYGDFRWNRALASLLGRRDLFLHAECLELEYQLQGRTFHFRAEWRPEDFWDFSQRTGEGGMA